MSSLEKKPALNVAVKHLEKPNTMPKRYKLLQPHPYTEKGTIVEECGIRLPVNHPNYKTLDVSFPDTFSIPDSVKEDWLEEVKEEPMCSPEFAEALSDAIATGVIPLRLGESVVADWGKLRAWIDEHTSKPE